MTRYSTTSDDDTTAQLRVIAGVLAARVLNAGAEIVITHEEYERMCEADDAANRGIMVYAERDTLTLRYVSLPEGEAVIERDRQEARLNDPAFQLQSAVSLAMVETLTDSIIDQGSVPDPEMGSWLVAILPELDAHADPNAQRAAAAVRRAMDTVVPGWRSLGGSDGAVEAPVAQA